LYTLRFVWNHTIDFWTLQVGNVENTEMFFSIKLTVGADLFYGKKYGSNPKGSLVVLPMSDDFEQIGYDSFTKEDAVLFYQEAL